MLKTFTGKTSNAQRLLVTGPSYMLSFVVQLVTKMKQTSRNKFFIEKDLKSISNLRNRQFKFKSGSHLRVFSHNLGLQKIFIAM